MQKHISAVGYFAGQLNGCFRQESLGHFEQTNHTTLSDDR